MADQNLTSEQDNAYIADLLKRLRESVDQLPKDEENNTDTYIDLDERQENTLPSINQVVEDLKESLQTTQSFDEPDEDFVEEPEIEEEEEIQQEEPIAVEATQQDEAITEEEPILEEKNLIEESSNTLFEEAIEESSYEQDIQEEEDFSSDTIEQEIEAPEEVLQIETPLNWAPNDGEVPDAINDEVGATDCCEDDLEDPVMEEQNTDETIIESTKELFELDDQVQSTSVDESSINNSQGLQEIPYDSSFSQEVISNQVTSRIIEVTNIENEPQQNTIEEQINDVEELGSEQESNIETIVEINNEENILENETVFEEIQTPSETSMETPIEEPTITPPIEDTTNLEEFVLKESKQNERKQVFYQNSTLLTDHVFKGTTIDSNDQSRKEKWTVEAKREKGFMTFRLVFAIVLTVFLVLFESIPSLSNSVLRFFLLTRVPRVFSLIDLQFLLLLAVLDYPNIVLGIRQLKNKVILPQFVSFITLSFAVLYDIINCIFYYSNEYYVGSVAAVVLTIDLLSSFFIKKTTYQSINNYSNSNKLKVGMIVREDNQNQFVVKESTNDFSFVPNLRFNFEEKKLTLVMLLISYGIALASSIVYFVLQQNVFVTIWMFLSILFGGCSLSCFLLHTTLFSAFSNRVIKDGVSVSSEDAIAQMDIVDCVVFEDTDIFTPGCILIKGIKLCGSIRLDESLYYIANAFSLVDGALEQVFNDKSFEIQSSNDKSLIELQENGFMVKIDDKEYLVGTKAYLEQKNVHVFHDQEDSKVIEKGYCILFLATTAKIISKYHLQYNPDFEFEKAVETYFKSGLRSQVLTNDPLFNQTLLEKVSYVSDCHIDVLHKSIDKIELDNQSTIICNTDQKSIRKSILLSKSYIKIQNVLRYFTLAITILLSLGLGLILNKVPLSNPIIPIGAQIVSLIPSLIVSLIIRTKENQY